MKCVGKLIGFEKNQFEKWLMLGDWSTVVRPQCETDRMFYSKFIESKAFVNASTRVYLKLEQEKNWYFIIRRLPRATYLSDRASSYLIIIPCCER